MAAETHIVAFLPFLEIDGPHNVAGVAFVPLRKKDGAPNPLLGDGTPAVAKILSSYRTRDNAPIENCSIATVADRGWDLVEADLGHVRWAASLLFLAAWSR